MRERLRVLFLIAVGFNLSKAALQFHVRHLWVGIADLVVAGVLAVAYVLVQRACRRMGL